MGLPECVLIEIFSKLDNQSLYFLSIVNKSFSKLIREYLAKVSADVSQADAEFDDKGILMSDNFGEIVYLCVIPTYIDDDYAVYYKDTPMLGIAKDDAHHVTFRNCTFLFIIYTIHKHLPVLKTLDLRNNHLTDVDTIGIIRHVKTSHIHILDMSENDISMICDSLITERLKRKPHFRYIHEGNSRRYYGRCIYTYYRKRRPNSYQLNGIHCIAIEGKTPEKGTIYNSSNRDRVVRKILTSPAVKNFQKCLDSKDFSLFRNQPLVALFWPSTI
jgi:hypothetical protein